MERAADGRATVHPVAAASFVFLACQKQMNKIY